MIEYNKLEIFHFFKTTKNFDLPPMDIESLGGPIL